MNQETVDPNPHDSPCIECRWSATESSLEARFETNFWNFADWRSIDRQWNGQQAEASWATRFASGWTTNYLYFAFLSRFQKLTMTQYPDVNAKTPLLWEKEDVVEVFIAPDAAFPLQYKEFELSPSSQWIDIDIDSSRGYKDFDWPSGMESTSRIDQSTKTWRSEFRVPSRAFGKPASEGSIMLINAYRVELASDLYLAWNPTMTALPNFHVPDRFGKMMFVR